MSACIYVQTVTFGVSVVTGDASVKTSKGVANEVVEESATQANYLQTAVQPGATLSNVALFVDSNREAIKPIAQTKTFWWWGPHWGWGGEHLMSLLHLMASPQHAASKHFAVPASCTT